MTRATASRRACGMLHSCENAEPGVCRYRFLVPFFAQKFGNKPSYFIRVAWRDPSIQPGRHLKLKSIKIGRGDSQLMSSKASHDTAKPVDKEIFLASVITPRIPLRTRSLNTKFSVRWAVAPQLG